MTDTTINWPDHYTPDDIAHIDTIRNWMNQKNYTQAALARLARISASSLNQIIRGSYATSPSKQIDACLSAMQAADDTTENRLPVVETSVCKLATTCCRMARRYHNFAVLSAYVGTGKTVGLKHYANTHPNTYIVEATPTMTTQSLIKQLAQTVASYSGKGSIDDRFRAIVDTLKNTDSLLIIDEAETLTPHQLHTLRRIRDLANIGIVLAGTEQLSGLIKPPHGQFDQIRSRTGFWPQTVQGISKTDAAALVQAVLGGEDVAEDVISRLYAYCKGSARMLVEGMLAGIREFRRGHALDVKLVDAVAQQALGLQSAA